ncbi:immunoglobulin superfamily member 11 isoform X1 [Panthera tigris]|uniref:immunoglobulin superfamily member 11 isoform X1 n=1 Tax=Panthera tigris TaxID=9694 RepID=UPI001C6FBB87|nr:immunoglobulin superfamily member 11 isoform X1 [Panthera tigris]XP_042855088.1 immunoglobulin superfamily member 11 isoform X1 [Panthera tigris]XP_042855089.1 immunoglobulin superfamily member 11 isoform X1 [Panthera tigris]XP_042855090.1 immunoglobulin superfamily member 11 isoform X1 [Panthera tigris]XP_042855091.1 immunoglobulin superfamily member 11 isoform X1 [Panthera tigris]XP_042855092.1 immunoglobulin superfamily member 11 isoform X1 [Panthera tigris]XP_042855093.1 immunoglobulin
MSPVGLLLSWDYFSSSGVAASLEVSESPGSIQVARGQTAVLPCTFTTSAALINLNVIWMVIPLSNANQPEQVILYQGGQMFDGAPRFHGRVGFTGTMPATNVSIFINNTQLSDTGTYQCLVNNLPDRGGRNIGVTGLTVLVPPSAPHCQIQGSQDIGSDVILLCSSEEGIPRPTYLWEKLDNTLKLPPTATQDQVQGTVTIRNISALSSGLYQCVASNAIGTSTCLLDLQVISPQPRSIGLIAGAIGTGAVIIIFCIALILGAFFYWRSKNKEEEEEEIPNEIREDDLPPKCSSSAKAFHAEISSSENNTLTSSNTYNSRYWSNNPKVHRNTESFNHFSDLLHSGNANIPSIYANGNHLVPAPHKTLVVTANRGSSPQVVSRSNGSVSRKPRPQHTHSYTISQATLERIGAVPVMVPAQSRAGSLV